MKKYLLLIVSLLMCMLLITGCTFKINIPVKKNLDSNKFSVENTKYTANDNSYLILEEYGKKDNFKWYESREVLDNNYYLGTYSIYIGDEAAKFITEEKSCYGVTKDELERVTNKDYSNLIVMYVNYSDIIIDGESKIAEFNNSIDKDNPKSMTYYGQYTENNLYLYNMMNANQLTFTKITDNNNDINKDINNDVNNDVNTDSNLDTNTSETANSMVKQKFDLLHYTIPKGFKCTYIGSTLITYDNEQTYDSLEITYFDDETLKYTKEDYPDGKDIKVDGHDAYQYVESLGNYTMYSISVIGNGGEYIFSSENESILNEFINSLKF